MALVTAQQIKTRTSLGGNVDADKFMHLVTDAEMLVLEPSLGTALYDKIVSEKNADTLSNNYLILYTDYIVPVLCYSVYSEFLRDGIILAQNTGIYENTPDDKTGADIDNIQYIAKANKSKADAFIERMERFLCDVDLPEYDNAQANNYDIDPTEINTISGWYLPKSKPNGINGITLTSGGSSQTTSEEMQSKEFTATDGQTEFIFASAEEAFTPKLVFEQQGLLLGWTYSSLNLTITLTEGALAGATITVVG
jgi:hypothetical protein